MMNPYDEMIAKICATVIHGYAEQGLEDVEVDTIAEHIASALAIQAEPVPLDEIKQAVRDQIATRNLIESADKGNIADTAYYFVYSVMVLQKGGASGCNQDSRLAMAVEYTVFDLAAQGLPLDADEIAEAIVGALRKLDLPIPSLAEIRQAVADQIAGAK
jgi:hypothetical protein